MWWTWPTSRFVTTRDVGQVAGGASHDAPAGLAAEQATVDLADIAVRDYTRCRPSRGRRRPSADSRPTAGRAPEPEAGSGPTPQLRQDRQDLLPSYDRTDRTYSPATTDSARTKSASRSLGVSSPTETLTSPSASPIARRSSADT